MFTTKNNVHIYDIEFSEEWDNVRAKLETNRGQAEYRICR